jgi:hypothetical protein
VKKPFQVVVKITSMTIAVTFPAPKTVCNITVQLLKNVTVPSCQKPSKIKTQVMTTVAFWVVVPCCFEEFLY